MKRAPPPSIPMIYPPRCGPNQSREHTSPLFDLRAPACHVEERRGRGDGSFKQALPPPGYHRLHRLCSTQAANTDTEMSNCPHPNKASSDVSYIRACISGGGGSRELLFDSRYELWCPCVFPLSFERLCLGYASR